MNWASPRLADRKVLQNERLLQAEEARTRKLYYTKNMLIISKLLSFRGWQGLSGRLPHSCSPGSSRLTGLRFHFWKNQHWNKSQFGELGLSISDSILGLLSCFWHITQNIRPCQVMSVQWKMLGKTLSDLTIDPMLAYLLLWTLNCSLGVFL